MKLGEGRQEFSLELIFYMQSMGKNGQGSKNRLKIWKQTHGVRVAPQIPGLVAMWRPNDLILSHSGMRFFGSYQSYDKFLGYFFAF